MRVRLKDPKKVYFDIMQLKTFYGPKVQDTKVTAVVRQLLNIGVLIEVAEEAEEVVTPEAKEAEVKKVAADKVAATKAAKEAAAKKVTTKEKA